jgi:hypothetical protein
MQTIISEIPKREDLTLKVLSDMYVDQGLDALEEFRALSDSPVAIANALSTFRNLMRGQIRTILSPVIFYALVSFVRIGAISKQADGTLVVDPALKNSTSFLIDRLKPTATVSSA